MRIQPKVQPNHPGFHRLPQEGDVICVIPDSGWDIGRLDMCNPDIAILHLTDTDQAEAELQFMAREPGDLRENPNLRRRAATIDRQALPLQVRSRVLGRRGLNPNKPGGEPKTWAEVKAEFDQEGGPIPVTLAQLVAARVVKPVVPNPFTVGRNPFVVG